jgi:serine/threonine protein kinase
MNCPEVEFFEQYVHSQLTEAESAGFKTHLQECSKCASRVNETLENESLLAELRASQTTDSLVSADNAPNMQEVITVKRAQSLLGQQYHVIRKVGQGGFGEVFQVIDTVLDRTVAVKFLNKSCATESMDEERWREARLMSRLNHPNIAQVYHIGEQEGVRFIMMEWVDGLPLTEVWRDMALQQKLAVFLQVAETISVAHKRNIIHRDIKPSNILVNTAGQVKVLDFGIALDESALRSIKEDKYRGTPAYSAPEQITVPVKISTATDVFALGVLLYQLLTDTLPYPQTNPDELFDAIKTQYPALPSAIQEEVPIPLQNICLKALEKNPHRRYPNAHSLSNEINRYLRGEKVWSRPSFLTDKIQQELFYHRQKLKVWQDNDLLTQREVDKLENIYTRVISPPDPSIIESRKLSFSQVCLYLGGWITVIGSFVLFYNAWEHVPKFWRPVPAVMATALMVTFGVRLWRRKESRLAVGFLATANLLIPITILLTLGQWQILTFAYYPWGQESIPVILENAGSYLIVGNVQLYISSWCWLAFSLIILRLTRSSIFVLFSIIAFFVLLTTCYLIAGMLNVDEETIWAIDIIAGRYLFPSIALFIFGVILDHRRYIHYAWSFCIIGLAVIIISMSVIAVSNNTLFGWVLHKPKFLNDQENQLLSLVCNGIVYLVLAGICRLQGTRLQRTLSQALNWLGPLHILATMRILDDIAGSSARELIYRILLPMASFAFVFGSVARQMKSFFFSGLAGIAAAVHKLTSEYFKDYFAWPVSLIITGITWMFVSWWVPRRKASMALKPKE